MKIIEGKLVMQQSNIYIKIIVLNKVKKYSNFSKSLTISHYKKWSMKKQFLSISLLVLTISILVIGSLESRAFALTSTEQRNLIGFAIGCKGGLDGKNPNPTQYDKMHGLSNHTAKYNLGFINDTMQVQPVKNRIIISNFLIQIIY